MNAMYKPSAAIEELSPRTSESFEEEPQMLAEPAIVSKKERELMAKKEIQAHPLKKEIIADKVKTETPKVSDNAKFTMPETSGNIEPEPAEKIDKFAVKLVLIPKNEKQQEVREVKEEIRDEPPLMSDEQKQRVLDFLEKSQLEDKSSEPGSSLIQHTAPLADSDDIDPDMEDYEAEEYEDEMDEEDIEYDDEDLDDADMEDEELSDVDDSDLMKRLEEKYGKIDDKKYKTEDDDDWTSK